MLKWEKGRDQVDRTLYFLSNKLNISHLRIVNKLAIPFVVLVCTFCGRQISKSYLAVCVGNPGEGATIDVPIGRHPNHRQRMVAVPSIQPNIRARRAVSVVTMAAFDGKLSVAEVSIETGRTHQIRVHLQVGTIEGRLGLAPLVER